MSVQWELLKFRNFYVFQERLLSKTDYALTIDIVPEVYAILGKGYYSDWTTEHELLKDYAYKVEFDYYERNKGFRWFYHGVFDGPQRLYLENEDDVVMVKLIL
jgi:hypothetical protein